MVPAPSVLLDPCDDLLAAAQSSETHARAHLTRALGWASLEGRRALEDPLADLLLERVLDHEGPFAAAAERQGVEGMSRGLLKAGANDLRTLQGLAAAVAAPGEPSSNPQGGRADIKRSISAKLDWGNAVPELAKYFSRYGAGILGRHRVFRWDTSSGLDGVDHPDPITTADLVGYEPQRAPLRSNLQAFVAGRPANNALLYGDRGSGKSSTVKALAAEFPMEQLRLIEVTRDQLVEFPSIAATLRPRPARFLLMVDDLAFEEGEVHYGALKSVLEGGVESQPTNVVLYATSNRRHLVREVHADRQGDGEVHISETFQEKLSLSDRFGLRVLFVSPDQAFYLEICRELAARRGLDLDHQELKRNALLWCRRHNARSCRTARQFVDDLEGRADPG
jgi:predicted AAA+ superfamily ATPase